MDIFLPAIDTVTHAEAGVVMPIVLPNGQPFMQKDGKTPVTLTLLGADSKTVRDANITNTRKRVDAGATQGTFEEQVDAADFDAITVLVAATINWAGITDSKGKEVTLTPESTRFLYTKFPAIRDQAENFVGRRANFTPRS